MKLEALRPLHVRRASGDLHLRPGYPVELPDEEAARLLQKVPDKVRMAPHGTTVTIEPALTANGGPLSVIYWETGDGRILGPAVPEFLAREKESFWIVTSFDGRSWWINADRLRSRRAFEGQVTSEIVEPVKEPL